jgi:hypothetical protein
MENDEQSGPDELDNLALDPKKNVDPHVAECQVEQADRHGSGRGHRTNAAWSVDAG